MNEERGSHLEIDYTAGSYKILIPFLDQTGYDVRNRVFLDIGAGQSDIAATMRKRGAIAYATDPMYEDQEGLDRRTSETLKKSGNIFNQTRENFRTDSKQNPNSYIAGVSGALPFRSSSIDLIYSEQCICPVISRNFAELEKSVREVSRVLRVGGIAVIFPFDNHEELSLGQSQQAKEQENNLQMLLANLDLYISLGYTLYQIPIEGKEPHDPLRERRMLVIAKG